jgi:uncharacterized protein YgiM (DUF1202 family)
MKRKILFCLCALFLSASVAFAASTFKKGDKVYVTVKSASLKSGTGAFSGTTASVEYGDMMIVLQVSSKKVQVQLSSNMSKSGWIAAGSLTKKKIVKKTNGSSVRASTDELALAGKGFSEAAESAFKSSNKNLNYAEVDEVEKITVSQSDQSSFVKEGGLEGDAE